MSFLFQKADTHPPPHEGSGCELNKNTLKVYPPEYRSRPTVFPLALRLGMTQQYQLIVLYAQHSIRYNLVKV